MIRSISFQLLFFLLIGISCKAYKGTDDPLWKEESQKIAISLCNHYQKCLPDSQWNQIPEKWRELAQGKISENTCQLEFRKSKIFFLQVPDILVAKEAFTKCSEKVLALDCDALTKNGIDKIIECEVVSKLQSGSL